MQIVKSKQIQLKDELPLRAELFSALQMEQHGRVLANAHKLSTVDVPDKLLSRLADNEATISEACTRLTDAIKAGRQITPAAEWLLDNFYLIEEQIRTAKRHLPKNYSKALPRLLHGQPPGSPRVYDIALETISHGDGRVDPESLSRFVIAYQQTTTLKLGELWAIPIMLRLALIENLRRVAAHLSITLAYRNLAHQWADTMLDVADKNPSDLILQVADMARSDLPLESAFVAELVRRLQGQSPSLTLPLTWLAQRLSASGDSIEHMVQQESQRQAADQVSVSNSIGSLRFLSSMDWREFVETMSAVEHILRADPGDTYARMDFVTRDRYRHVVEATSRQGILTEEDVARQATALAREAARQVGKDDRRAHVGYYLIGPGLKQLQVVAATRLTTHQKLARLTTMSPVTLYLGAISLITALATWLVFAEAYRNGTYFWHPLWLTLFGIMAALPASQLAQAIVNWLVPLLVPPRLLPRMDLRAGIPPEYLTLVVVPTLLSSATGAESLVEALEVRFLANQDANLRYCLLTDFADAKSEKMPGDAALLAIATQLITDLNARYPRVGGDNFLLLHRPRRWSPEEAVWMGYERKRGKLSELNGFLRGVGRDAFYAIVGNTDGLLSTRYVITLDTDTELPRDAARQLVATMAHPLNRPLYNAAQKRISEGYGILQPRIAVSSPSAQASRYELMYGGEIGIDPYTRTVSDVYQDVFGEGSFVGKGIYDIDAFEQVLYARMPENRILSHDLLEGCYARAGLISDVQLYEQYPSRYSADVSRRHRWIRGDWQISAWLWPLVPLTRARVDTSSTKNASIDTSTANNAEKARNKKRRYEKNPLSTLSRWKLFDNLRRSLVAPALTVITVSGWIMLPQAWFWTGAVLTVTLAPSLCSWLFNLLRKPEEIRLQQHLSASLTTLVAQLVHTALTISLLPYESWYHLDAIVRTQWRLRVSHKHLLEWNSSGEANLRAGNTLRAYYAAMWQSPLLAAATAVYLYLWQPSALLAAAPLLLLWWLAPFIMYCISQPISRRAPQLDEAQQRYLSALARKIWLFFETYVGPADNWLPPDNMQEHPVEVLARRTSPTNIGLSLLANLTAYDFGYIPSGQLLERTRNTFQTMTALERYQGHFYNWYDTQYLHPLTPAYVSTVDSGNLAGHLLTLVPGLQQLADAPVLHPKLFAGIRDAYLILDELSLALPLASVQQLSPQFAAELDLACQIPPSSLSETCGTLEKLHHHVIEFARQLSQVSAPVAIDPIGGKYHQRLAQIRQWQRALESQCREALNELYALAPWLRNPHFKRCRDRLPQLVAALDGNLSLRQIAQLPAQLQLVDHIVDSDVAENDVALCDLQSCLKEASALAVSRLAAIDVLVTQATEFSRMEYRFLYDPTTHLLVIGYNVTERRRDTGFYDLLASEARLATFVAIAQGQLPQDSWFALGRQLTLAGGEPILLSWSGSMFEYLMPLLVMPNFTGTLLDQTYRSVVERQISYGAQRGVYWGMSESGYNSFDASLNYQYRTFGVPGLGFKRGLGDDLVIAPYASMMALMVAPKRACSNLQQMSTAGFDGTFGLYEAIDYTPSRVPRGQTHAVVRSFMAHHQGMGFLSLAYLLLDQPMQRRFESYPLFQATMSLLHERVPKVTASYSTGSELTDMRIVAGAQNQQIRVVHRPDPRTPEVQLLSNGRYHVMVTSAGGSYSRWNDLAVTRWSEDTTRDHWGNFCYVRDLSDGKFWSTSYQPSLTPPTQYEVIFSEGRAEFRRSDRDIDMHTEIVVSPEDDIELRRTKITNRSRSTRTLDITSYAEVVLAASAADASHPAFSNLFVQTEIDVQRGAILCTRRARSDNETVPWMFHLMAAHGAVAGAASYETDRMKFIGRGNTTAHPQAMRQTGGLSGSAGSVLDPIVAIRRHITLEPEQSVTIDMVTGVAASREACEELIGKYQDRHLADRVMELAWTHNQVVLRQLNANEADAQVYGRLANSVIYANSLLRADASILARNRRGQSALWSYAISGDLPIVLVQIRDMVNIKLVLQLVQAHAYWRSKGLAVDLVIWNEDHAGYRQVLQEQILNLISSVTGAHTIDRPGGIFVRLLDQISDEDRILFQSVARVVLSDSHGTLAEQVNRREVLDVKVPLLKIEQMVDVNAPPAGVVSSVAANSTRLFDNGIGSFSADGREYLIKTGDARYTPAPWSNVIANAEFGTVVSESGQAYSWADNAHEFRLTPWANDPVSDGGGEAFYLRDEMTGISWSPTPLPRRGSGDYLTRHGFGYSVFEHSESQICSELTMFVALDAPVKYVVLRVRNDSDRKRQLSATGYVEWVLGDLRAKTAMHVSSEIDITTGALLACNHYNTEFPQRMGFFDLDVTNRTVTGDRHEFIGRNRSLRNPAALDRQRLSGKVGAGLDPCAAIHTLFELNPGQTRELVFLLGVCDRRQTDAAALIMRHRGSATAQSALQAVKNYWQHTLSTIQVSTPEASLDVLANGWLLYQTLACRLWARSGYYQSGGAFGFRDQLQDAMALVHSEPALVRKHLLLCAEHQFIEGDVQHWWHPPTDRGVRTKCSDDYLWLPLAVHRYVTTTADSSVLDEVAPFIEGRPLGQDEDSYYDLPTRSAESATVYQHCVRAIQHGLRFGDHGLSLIGSCDWNDGMDKVGEHGKGESVWLSFFFYEVLMRFADIALQQQDNAFATICCDNAEQLRKNIEKNAWDGNWYLRAYFDDGTPLGSSANAECQIDSISQSWAVLSGAGDTERTQQAMQSVRKRLVRDEDKLIQLLDPPFDRAEKNPGYIRGYVPGVRENGGQYTHAAIWTIMAFSRMGDYKSAWDLMRMINPIHHGSTAKEIAIYKVEPYVVAADVYAVTPHTGRGGWTWYTGSAGWMYRLMIESLLGLHIEGDQLTINACVPPDWDSYAIDYRHGKTQYHIAIMQTTGSGEHPSATSFRLDGVALNHTAITLVDDQIDHRLEVTLS